MLVLAIKNGFWWLPPPQLIFFNNFILCWRAHISYFMAYKFSYRHISWINAQASTFCILGLYCAFVPVRENIVIRNSKSLLLQKQEMLGNFSNGYIASSDIYLRVSHHFGYLSCHVLMCFWGRKWSPMERNEIHIAKKPLSTLFKTVKGLFNISLYSYGKYSNIQNTLFTIRILML